MNTFKRYFLKALAFMLAGYCLARLFPAQFGLLNVNAKDNITSFYGYGISQLLACRDNTNCNIDLNWSNLAGSNLGEGFLVLNFDFNVSSSTTTSIPSIATLRIKSGSNQYACYGGSSSGFIYNSTSSGSSTAGNSYSFICPVNLGPQGISGLIVGLSGRTAGWEIQYRVGDVFTFVKSNNSDEVVSAIDKTNSTIKDDNVDGSTAQGSDFFKNFEGGNDGDLTSLISLPLNYVSHLKDQCKPVTLPLGKLGDVNIPCLSSVWSSSGFSGIIEVVSVIINGVICYKVGVNLIQLFKDLRDPDKDKLEVMDL